MTLPPILKNNPPRDIQYADVMFTKVRSMVRTAFTCSLLCIPIMGLGFWMKGSDPVDGVFAGVGIAAFVDFIVLAVMLNFKYAVSVCRDGVSTIGTITKKLSSKNLSVRYNDQQGRAREGMAFFIGASLGDLNQADKISIVFLDAKPWTFVVYLENEGISMIGNGRLSGLTLVKDGAPN